MTGIHFAAFLTLLVLGLFSSIVFHVIVRYRVLGGVNGLIYTWIAGWTGAWLGSPVLGHWGVIHAGNVYFIPAILGAFTGSFVAVALFKASAFAAGAAPRQTAMPIQHAVLSQSEMRKIS